MTFDPFDRLDIHVRRPLAPSEDQAATLMPAMLGDTETDPDRQYRRIGEPYPLNVAVHAGGTFNVYGVLLITPKMFAEYSNISISIIFLGTSKTVWKDGFCMRGRKRVFIDIRKPLLVESDPFPWDGKSPFIHLPFSFFITTASEGNGLPITFSSPSSSVTYAIRARVSYSHPKNGLSSVTLEAPVKVEAPWLNAPPPATPALGPQEDGVRWVLDPEDGSCQGRVSVLRSDGLPDYYDDSCAFLRTKVLTNMPDVQQGVGSNSYPPIAPWDMQNVPTFNLPEMDDHDDHDTRRERSVASSSTTVFPALDFVTEEEGLFECELPNSPPMRYSEVDPLSISLGESSDWKHGASSPGEMSPTSPTFDELNHSVCFDPAISPSSYPGSIMSHDTFHRRDEGVQLHSGTPDLSYYSSSSSPPGTNSHLVPDNDRLVHAPPKPSKNPVMKFIKSLVTSISDVPKFRIIFPCTMIGPGTKIPLDVLIKSVPHGHVLCAIEAILVARVVCMAFGAVHEDRIELASMKKKVEPTEDSSVFKERLWLQVPKAEEMSQYGADFKAPLIELHHSVIVNLYSCRRKRADKVKNQEFCKLYNLGSVSMVLTR
ncbi:hypothetical protein BJ741DRAFT_664815 [Chytriomyces cf. hyalinus JEL632]|nr:hypothetical protein BJ741DRAFT_664815 [Chytriomyces cf. hyalinus JEL632]